MRIRYTPQAVADLVGIAEYLRCRNPSAAIDVENTVRSTIELLEDFPRIGRDRPELNARSLAIPRFPYTAYYRIEDDEIWIVHIRDDRRKPPGRDDV